MTTRAKIFAAVVACWALGIAPLAMALNNFDWKPALTGAQDWQVSGNWVQPNFPNSGADTANVSVASDLTLDVGATNVAVAALTLNGTSAGTDINVASAGGGRLILQNDDNNVDFDSNPNDTAPPVLTYIGVNLGRVLVTSSGAAGSTNTISAPVRLNNSGPYEGADFLGTNSITLSGGFDIVGDDALDEGTLRSYLSPGAKLLITTNINLVDPVDGTTTRRLNLNTYGSTDHGTPPRGTLEITGAITGPGGLDVGWERAVDADTLDPSPVPALPLSTVILSGDNSFSDQFTASRANIELRHDHALGQGTVRQAGQAQQVGYNFISDNDARTISNYMEVAQWQTFKGEHSLTWTGRVNQSNNRGWINLLPADKTLTLSGPLYVFNEVDSTDRRFVWDGTGTTIITGGLHNRFDAMGIESSEGNPISYVKRGTGVVVVSGSASTFAGSYVVEGGNLHFATNTQLGSASAIVSNSGAIGVDSGVLGNSAFLNLLSPDPDTNGLRDVGGLMLATGEYGTNLDFTASGNLSKAGKMSLAAQETGSAYTGTITPLDSTYRLGGGSGTLTLPNANQLTGANSLLVVNGGEVALSNTNNYTGTTTLMGSYFVSLQNQAANDDLNLNDGNLIPDDHLLIGTTVAASVLANGGSDSSIGKSSNAASNLFIQGSTLKYVGGGVNTDRLFTIGTSGATIDSSGGGAVNFTNTAALGVDVAESRLGDENAFVTNGRRFITNLATTDDLQPGMPVGDVADFWGPTFVVPGAIISRINGPTSIEVTPLLDAAAFALGRTITFGAAPARALSLSGTNTGNNTLAPLVANASDGGVVGINKSGSGKWILTGNNTYSGATNVQAGTLLVNGTQTGTGLTTVSAGATLGGTGTLGGAITNNGIVAPGASVGTLSVNGNVTMAENSHLAIEVSGATADKLAIIGNLDLSALANSLDVTGPAMGSTSWVIATYTGMLTGAFESITAGYSVNYGSGTNSLVTLNVVTGVAGDYNNNGKVDIGDYNVWRDHLGANFQLQHESGQTPGMVTIEDYNYWKAHYGEMAPAAGGGSLAGNNAVPEPAGFLLAALAALGMFGVARRRSIGA